MNVLVWQSYGNVRVYPAETPLHFMKIYDALKREIDSWGEDEALAKLFEDMGTCGSQLQCKRVFEAFVRPHLNTHETFETFEFTKLETTE